MSDENKLITIRTLRNALLNATDKYICIPDYPLTTEQRYNLILYRKQLRDLPATVNLSDYNEDNILQCFPEKPNYINLSAFYSQ